LPATRVGGVPGGNEIQPTSFGTPNFNPRFAGLNS
jgi:hypothetical protein